MSTFGRAFCAGALAGLWTSMICRPFGWGGCFTPFGWGGCITPFWGGSIWGCTPFGVSSRVGCWFA